MDSSANQQNGEGDGPSRKDNAPKEQSRQSAQEERDAEAKRRAVGGRARAPVTAPGAVQSSHPAGGKGGRARSSATHDAAASNTSSSSAAAASRAAVERNMENRDALAKRRAAARGAPAVTPGVVAERSHSPPPPPPAPVVSNPEPKPGSLDHVEEGRATAPAEVVSEPAPAAAVAPVAAVAASTNSAVPEYAESSADVAYAAGVDEAFEDVEKPLDDYDESQKENNNDLGPEAAVTHAMDTMGDVELTEAPVVYPGADPNMHDGVVADGIEAFVADTVVDATGVAVVMSEEEEEQFEQKRRKKYLCYGAVVLVIVAVSIVVPVVLLVGGGGPTLVELPPSVAPSGFPSSMPSAAPTTSIFSELLDYLETLPFTPEGLFEDRTAPQYLAALWLADEDQFIVDQGLAFSDPKALQRYAVATFYYATGGDNWKLCGANSPSCGDVEWLSDSDECTWFSIDCEGTSTVTQINFPATGNDLIGELPPEMSLLTGLTRFLAPENSLKGDLDVAFGQLTELQTIAMPDNRLEGTIPTGILVNNPNLGFLDLGSNQFNGPIPSEIAGATKLSDLQLDTNELTGTIPAEIGDLGLLMNFEIQTNNLVGTIPSEMYGLTKLSTISLRENQGINGTISPLVSQLTALGVLQLGFTGLGGPIPEEMFLLTDLSEMNLEGASFSGTIPESFKRLNASLMDLFLNDNEFTGSVPVAFDFLTALETLQIQGNQLTGSISAAVCAERGLRFQQLATLIVDCVVECGCCDNCEE